MKGAMVHVYAARNAEELLEEVAAFASGLRARHPDFADYVSYHALAFSGSIPGQEPTHLDFEGEDSVTDFLEALSRRIELPEAA